MFLGITNIKENEIILAFKNNKLLQKEDTTMKISKVFHKKINS